MSAEFFAVKEPDPSRPDHATKTTYVNLDAILYVEDHGIEGEPIKIWCRNERGYYLVGHDADQLIERLKQRAHT